MSALIRSSPILIIERLSFPNLMHLIRLFDGPIPVPPRLYVAGVDLPRAADLPLMVRIRDEADFLLALCQLPATPFTGRFGFRPE